MPLLLRILLACFVVGMTPKALGLESDPCGIAQSTVDRPPMRGEVDVQRRARFAQGITRALYVIGGLGALAAAVAGVSALASGKRS